MGSILPQEVRFAYFHSFWNMPELLRSRRIGCTHCGFIFLYDGTEDTAPQSMDNKTGECPVCGFPALVGDASGMTITGINLMHRMIPYRRKLDLPSEEHPPCEHFAPEIPDRPESLEKRGRYSPVEAALILACGNGKTVARARLAWCFSCQKTFVPEPIQQICALCPYCNAPTVLPDTREQERKKIISFLRKNCHISENDAIETMNTTTRGEYAE